MANININRKEFEKHIKLTKEIEEKIPFFGTPLESLSQDTIELEIFPNRPDMLSLQGFLRAFKAFLGKEPGLKKYKTINPQLNHKVIIDPSVKTIRPYTACAIVKNLSFNDEKIKEIIDIQEKIHSTFGRNRKKIAIGIYPLEKIKLPIKYEARSPKDIVFTPLEFNRELNALQILQQHPAGRDYAHLLQDLNKFPIFIDSNNKILSMPPIINSNDTGKISHETKEIFIECSGFDFNALKIALNIIVTSLADMGGIIYQMELLYEKKEITPNLNPDKTSISLDNTNKLLGLSLKEKDLEKLLPRMGYDYKKGTILIPAWRADILHEVDIIEDIAIAYGYNNLIPQLPEVATMGEESQSSIISRKIAEILIGLQLLETSSYHLIKKDESLKMKCNNIVEVLESKTDYSILRPNLLIPMLRILAENKDNEYPQKIFELGTIFEKDSRNSSESGVKESQHLIIACSPSNFTEVKQILNYLFKMLSLDYTIKESIEPGLIEGRTGAILVNNTKIGYLGEVHPQTLRDWYIKMPLAVVEISLDEIINTIK